MQTLKEIIAKNSGNEWLQFLDFVIPKIPPAEFENWLAPIRFISSLSGEIIIEVPNQFVYKYLIDNFEKELKDFIPLHQDGSLALSYIIGQSRQEKTAPKPIEIRPPSLSDFGVPEILSEADFSSCYQPSELIQKLKAWSINPQGLLIFAGGSGRGKTFAAACCIKEYLSESHGSDVIFKNIARLCLEWKEIIATQKPEIYLLEKLENKRLLILDDLGQRDPSPAFLDFLYLLIDSRLNKRTGGMIITTNFTSAVLREKLGGAVTSRICSGEAYKFEGEDRRLASF